jgi:hypothetical protein
MTKHVHALASLHRVADTLGLIHAIRRRELETESTITIHDLTTIIRERIAELAADAMPYECLACGSHFGPRHQQTMCCGRLVQTRGESSPVDIIK